jgi:hypothetical protein
MLLLKNVRLLGCVILLGTTLLATPGSLALPGGSKKPAPSNVELAATSDVSAGVEAVLASLMNEAPSELHLQQAVLSMQYGSAKEGGITLTLVVFTIGHKSKKGMTRTTAVTFGEVKLKEFTANFVAPSLDEQFRDQLKDAVVAASKVHTLPVTKITVKQEFAVSKDINGGLTFKVFNGEGSIGGTIDVNKTSVNSLELTYSKPKKEAPH